MTERMWRPHTLKPTYDVVIIGAGVHGLAIAYYLGKRGITNVAVPDQGYIGGGASGRNTAIIRSNYRTPEGVAFYDESVKLYENLALELDYNVMFSQHGHLTVAHTDRGVTTLRERGTIATPLVVNATAGWCSTIASMVDVELPIVPHPLQALVTERLKPFLHLVIVSATLHVYVNQTDRGEVVIGEEIDPYSSYSMRSTLRFLENAAAHTLELFPCLRRVKVLRQWAGLCDMPPDFAPIIGRVDGLEGFLLDVGWGTYGFKAGPRAGLRVAELIATGKGPP